MKSLVDGGRRNGDGGRYRHKVDMLAFRSMLCMRCHCTGPLYVYGKCV